ncbi:unnamed protein product, partial [Prorocentrum cordatum]
AQRSDGSAGPNFRRDALRWNAAHREVLRDAKRGTPPASRALCPRCRFPLEHRAGGSGPVQCCAGEGGPPARCARSTAEVPATQPHWHCPECEAVVCLREGPSVFVEHEYDIFDARQRDHLEAAGMELGVQLHERRWRPARQRGQHDPGPNRHWTTGAPRWSGRALLGSDGAPRVDRCSSLDGEAVLLGASSPAAARVLRDVLLLGRRVAQEQDEDEVDRNWAGAELADLSAEDMIELATSAEAVLANEACLVDAPVPCVVFGDTHGQLRDIILFFNTYGWPYTDCGRDFIFNGDYVDRGAHQVEVCALMFALKIIYRRSVWLVRGNHEDLNVNLYYGFYGACQQRFGTDADKVFRSVQGAFNQLPLGCLIGGKVLAVHGGIGKGDWMLDDLRRISKPISSQRVGTDEFIHHVLWSDPVEDDDPDEKHTFGLHQSPRGKNSLKFGWNLTVEFCKRNGLGMIIRSHQVSKGGFGFDVMHESMLVRVFTARDYEGNGNDGAILLVTQLESGVLSVRAQILCAVSKGRRLSAQPSPSSSSSSASSSSSSSS